MIAVRLGCRASFLPAARYVFQEWSVDVGEPIRFVGDDEQADVAYGADVHADDEFAAALERGQLVAPAASDPVATAFWQLAGCAELAAPTDAWGRVAAPPADLLALPVDDAFDRISAVARRSRRPLVDGSFAIALSHDVDVLRLFGPTPVARLALRTARTRDLRELRGLATAARRQRDPYRALAPICRLEAEHGARSTFYFLTTHTDPLDGPDGRAYRRLLPAAVGEVAAAGAEVGLHASTAAADRTDELGRQRDELARVAGAPIDGLRFHNLMLRVPGGLDRIEAAGFAHDSTLGFSAVSGFRSGTSRPFRPYSLALARPLDLVEVPLAAMETTFLSPRYLNVGPDAAFDRIVAVLEQVRRAGGAASLLWHNNAFDDPLTGGYGTLYRRLLEWIAAAGGRAVTVGKLASAYRDRLPQPAPM